MSDDLISRKTLLDYIDVGHLRNSDEKCFSERDVVEMIGCMDCRREFWLAEVE